MDISNKTLAVLIVIAILLSITGISFYIKESRITGFATDAGQLDVGVSTKTAINFTDASIDWGTGYVTEGESSCTLDTEGTNGADCTDFTTQSDGFTLENIGNQNVVLEIATGKDASTLLGGTSPSYQYKVDVNEAGSCKDAACDTVTAPTPASYTNVNATSPGTTICECFLASDASDTLDLDINLVVPSDSSTGTLTDTFTATATAV